MAKLRLSMACDSYDYLQPIREGKVEADGIELNLIDVSSGIRHQRMYNYGEYDVCEFSMSSYLVARSRDIDWFPAIPYFTRRMFCHKFCFTHAGSDITKPSDLKGRKIGIRTYENTLALMVKGMFMHNYNLSVDEVTWVCVNDKLVGTNPPSNIKVEQIEGKKKLEELLLAKEIDADAEPDLPQGWLNEDGKVKRLFPDFEKAERDYYQKTKIFPIMHPIVIKKEILDRDPWVATSLYELFTKTWQHYRNFMQQPHRLSFAWARSYLEQERAFFGRDPYAQGLKENHTDLKTMIQFAQEQGMLDRPLTVEELFTENTRAT